MRSALFITLISLFLLTACNLQQASDGTTPEATSEVIQQTDPSPTVESAPAQPTTEHSPLLPTPVQVTAVAPPVVTATLPPLNTLPPQGSSGENGTALPPTLDPASADNIHEIEARANTQIGLNYEATVEGGSVQLILQGPDGIIWEKTLTQTETDRIEFTTTQAGTYRVLVNINQLAGNYSILWD